MIRLFNKVTFWLLADARRRIQQLATSIDVLDREIDALVQAHLERRARRQ